MKKSRDYNFRHIDASPWDYVPAADQARLLPLFAANPHRPTTAETEAAYAQWLREQPKTAPVQTHPAYHAGFYDAAEGAPLFDDATPEYRAGWNGLYVARAAFDQIVKGVK